MHKHCSDTVGHQGCNQGRKHLHTFSLLRHGQRVNPSSLTPRRRKSFTAGAKAHSQELIYSPNVFVSLQTPSRFGMGPHGWKWQQSGRLGTSLYRFPDGGRAEVSSKTWTFYCSCNSEMCPWYKKSSNQSLWVMYGSVYEKGCNVVCILI